MFADGKWLAVVFLGLMGISMLAYVILDGYDLGVGILLHRASDEHKNVMISSIGPFWDANETWLVLGVGILLVAFPSAHGVILTALYLPVAVMLLGLILRGVAFDFRVKAEAHHKPLWNFAFYAGSLLASFSQGVMLGLYITGFNYGALSLLFALITGLCLCAGYGLLGSGWLLMKTTGELQQQAVVWAQRSLWLTGLGIAAISIVTPMVSQRIFEKWFTLPYLFMLMPIPIATAILFFVIDRALRRLPKRLAEGNEYGAWVPFAATVGIFLLAFYGLAYSLFPYLVVDHIDIWQAASAPESLKIILAGTAVVLPAIFGYTIYAYRVFWGKARELTYY
ncbi:MAG: cytochrome d ubiquinol oxidase subunit II [Rhodocyclaceae bacterium]|nr:cytochrome d ubiquinol oxidase subunit II [Rhodocyclaceae bacterium]MCA3028967.1 cytochrome d ubiquinol oxidase subunit II [Rhodocyclaceae bacterium]MCA3032203.1 cytochrome d ubiquinol oxidase subunit II [Rhodocyclaceae bacterium]MCA3035905.1 cytochrome d ubiquinol oxidase subunit II [Rhodocyclaceae bacterium]MCA3042682.1 cytochrome d ubiquinol oxidase subunit II [Rhodocyclaceae bacterium]